MLILIYQFSHVDIYIIMLLTTAPVPTYKL